MTIRCPAIVDDAVFQQVQARLAANAQFASRHNTCHAYLLRGLIRCGKCGGAYVGATRKNKAGHERGFYRCNCRDPYKMGNRPLCTGFGHLNAEAAEQTVWETCLELLRPEVLEQEYRRRVNAGAQNGGESGLRKLQADLKVIERQEHRWQDAYAAEAIDLPTLKARMNACRAQRQAVEARRAALGQAQERREHEARVLASLEAFARSVGEGLETADFAKRQEVIRLMVERVVVEEGGRLRIELAIPLGGPGGGAGGGHGDPQAPAAPSVGVLRPSRLDGGVHHTPGASIAPLEAPGRSSRGMAHLRRSSPFPLRILHPSA